MKNKKVNALAGIGLIVVVAVAAAILIMTNMPKTPVATVTSTPAVSSEPTTAPVVTGSPMTTTSAKNLQWKQYSNAQYGISFEYPANTNVSADDRMANISINISGKDNPRFLATFFSVTDKKGLQGYLNNKNGPFKTKPNKPSRTIAGVRAVHDFYSGKSGPATDTYYLMKNSKLYIILFRYDNGEPDLTETNHFLDSIQIK